MRLGDLDALSAFVGDLRSTLHKEQFTFKAMTQSEFEIKDNMLLNFQYAIDNAPIVEAYPFEQVQELVKLNQQFAQEIETLKRPQGEWSEVIDYSDEYEKRWHYECSKCRNIPYYGGDIDTLHFCPTCGAEMKGGAEK